MLQEKLERIQKENEANDFNSLKAKLNDIDDKVKYHHEKIIDIENKMLYMR